MLHDTRPIHAVDIRQGNGLLVHLVDPDVSESDLVVEAHTKDRRRDVGNDVRQFCRIGGPSLSIEGIVLSEVFGNVLVESANNVLCDVKVMNEVEEDLALIRLGCWTARAVRYCSVGADFGVGVMAFRNGLARKRLERVGRGEDSWEGRDSGKEY